MSRRLKATGVGLASALVGLAMLTACSTTTLSDLSDASRPVSIDCEAQLNRVMALVRAEPSDAGSDELNGMLDSFGRSCPQHDDVFVDYVSGQGSAEALGAEPCSALRDEYGLEPRAIEYSSQDGYCTGE